MAKNTNKLTLKQVLISILGALIGVQSSKINKRDFESGNPFIFIVMGIIVVTAFIITLITIAKIVT